MSVRNLRWRVSSVLIAAGAASVQRLGAGGARGRVHRHRGDQPGQAGYTATGAQFETVAASVFLRQPGQYAGQVASIGHSVQLWSDGLVVILGVTASTSGGRYTTYATIYDRARIR